MDDPPAAAAPAAVDDPPITSSSLRRAVYEEAARVLAEATLQLIASSPSAGTPSQPIERVSIALGVLQDAILALDQQYLLLEAEGAAVVASSLAARAAAAAATLAGAAAPPVADDAIATQSSLSAAITLYESRFRDLVVLPTLKRLSGGSAAKKPPAEKAVVAAKAVGALLAKSANPNKQPSFAQFLPSALRPAASEGSSSSSATKKGQLDCVGAATAVLAAVQAVAREEEQAHASLAGARLAFSDDHSWLVFGRRAADEEEEEEDHQDGQGAAGEPHSPAASSSSSSLLGPAWGAEEEDDDDQEEEDEQQQQTAGPSKRRRRRLSFLLRGGGRHHDRDASPGAAARRLAPPPSGEEKRRSRRRHHFLHRHRRHQQDSSSSLSAVEATDARVLKPGEARGWLYALPPQLAAEEAGQPGLVASPRQLPAILAAALVPEDVCPLRPPKSAAASSSTPPRGSEDAADAMRAAQLLLLERLAPLPEGVFVGGGGGGVASTLPPSRTLPFYSTLFRWGLAAEELELERLERAADTRDPKKVRVALRRNAQQHPPPPSQDLFRLALRLSDGRQWQPASCALFGRLQRLQSAFCGSEGVELVLGKRRPASAAAAAAAGKPSPLDPSILQLAEALLADALAAVRPAVDVLRAYSGAAAAAGGGQKAAVRDAPLIRGPRDALEHLADAFHGMARLIAATETVASNGDAGRGAAVEAQQQGADAAGLAAREEQATAAAVAVGAPAPAPKPPVAATMSFSAPASAQDRMRADLEAALAAARRPQATTGALPPTPEAAAEPEPEPAPPAAAAAPDHQGPSTTWQLGPERSTWLVPALLLVDSALEYWGADSPDADAATVDHFLHAASAFSPAAVRAAVEGARPQLQSDRLRAMAGGELEAVAAAAAAAGAAGSEGGGAAATAALAAAKSALLMPRKRARRG